MKPPPPSQLDTKDFAPPEPSLALPGTVKEQHRTIGYGIQPGKDDTPALPDVPGFILEKELGRGGMGVVYRARQIPLNRLVALKMILAGDHASPEAKTRFLAEAEAIAKVHHPGIVQVHEFGAHQGNPYFALEYIDGDSLDRVLAHGPLLPRDAARLVAQLADAVQAAHQAGIMHRDLKPGNILLNGFRHEEVSALKNLKPEGSLPPERFALTPKITDFGLAKQIDTGPGLTLSGSILGTPSYLSPEQAGGRIKEIGPATDIYSLGAILYECLTGRPPFRGSTVWDTLDQVLRRDPVPVRQLQPNVPRDLETVCHKCLHKEPFRRYDSAAALASDLRNCLEGQPITARPVSRWERSWKWCRRYPVVAALLVVTTLTAVAAIGLAAWAIDAEREAVAQRDERDRQRQRAEDNERAASEQRHLAQAKEQAAQQARAQAEQEKAVALAVRKFLQTRLLRQANPWEQARLNSQKGAGKSDIKHDVTVRTLLDRAAQEFSPETIALKFPGQPVVQAEVLETIGETYGGLNEHATAVAYIKAACRLRETHMGASHPATLASLLNLGLAHAAGGNHAEAGALALDTMDRIEALFKEDAAGTAAGGGTAAALDALLRLTEQRLGWHSAGLPPISISAADGPVLLLRANQAVPRLKRLSELSTQRFGPTDRRTLFCRLLLGCAYHAALQVGTARDLYESILTDAESVLHQDDWLFEALRELLCVAYQTLNVNLEQQIRLRQISLATKRRIVGNDHPSTYQTLNGLAVLYVKTGKTTEAIPLFEQVLDAQFRQFGADDAHTLDTLGDLVRAYRRVGRWPEVGKLVQQWRTAYETKFGRDDAHTLRLLNDFGVFYQDAGKLPEAIQLHEQVRAVREAKFGPDHPDALISLINLAVAYRDSKRFPEAIALLERVYAVRKRNQGTDHADTLQALHFLAGAFWKAGKFPETIQRLEELHAARSAKLGTDHQETLVALGELAFACREAGRLPEAITYRKQLHAARAAKLGPDDPATLTTLNDLAWDYQTAKNVPEARRLHEQVLKTREAKLGPDHPDTLITVHDLAWMRHHVEGKVAEALPMFERAAVGMEKAQYRHRQAASVIGNTARAYEDARQWDKAETWRRKWLAVLKERHGSDNTVYASELAALGLNLLRQQKWPAAEATLRECLAIREKQEPDTWRLFNTRSSLGEALAGQKKYADAEPLLLAGYQGLQQHANDIPPNFKALRLREAAARLVDYYTALNKPDEVKKWEAEREKYAPQP